MSKTSLAPRNKTDFLFVYRNPALNEVLDSKDECGLPQDFLYGMSALSPAGNWINVPKGARVGLRRLTNVIEWPFTRLAKLGFPLEIYPQFKAKLNRSRVVFGINDAIGFGLLFYKRLGLLKADVWVIAQSVHERALRHFKLKWLTMPFVRWLLKGAERVFVLSDAAKEPMIVNFGVDAKTLHKFSFGADTQFWKPARGPRSNYVLSIGNDSNRDYKTLLAATTSNVPVRIITHLSVERSAGELMLESSLSFEQVRERYQSAALVVIPTTELLYESSGLSCALQAAACGAPLILPAIPALQEIFKNKEHCLFYKPGDSRELGHLIEQLLEDKKRAARMGRRAASYIKKYLSLDAPARSIRKVLQKKAA